VVRSQVHREFRRALYKEVFSPAAGKDCTGSKSLAGSGPPESQMRMTYKLVPRTIELIDKLAETDYDDAGQVLAACMKALKMKKLT